MNISLLPHINASLNLCSALLLTAGFVFIRRRNVRAHLRCMLGALACSALFLACYLIYHYNAGRTVFQNPAWFRPYYLLLLLTHTVLAVAILPMIFITLRRALTRRFHRHRRIAQWTWPVWMYVSVTGVLIYLLLYHIFPQR